MGLSVAEDSPRIWQLDTIFSYFKDSWNQGVWTRSMEELRQLERRCQGRHPEPSAGSIDSQSIRTATQQVDIGYDGNKRIEVRERHILVDRLGLIIAVVLTDASTNDREGLVEQLTAYFTGGPRDSSNYGWMVAIHP